MFSNGKGETLKGGCVHVVSIIAGRVTENDEVTVGGVEISHNSRVGGGGPVVTAENIGAYQSKVSERKVVDYCSMNHEKSGSYRN